MGPNRATDLAPFPAPSKGNDVTAASRPVVEDSKHYQGEPAPGDALVSVFLVVPKEAPQQIDARDPLFEAKLNMVREGSFAWVSVIAPQMLLIRAASKSRVRRAIDAVITVLGKDDLNPADFTFHLVQMPAACQDDFRIKYQEREPLRHQAHQKPLSNWRVRTDPFPSVSAIQAIQEAAGEGDARCQDEFLKYAARFRAAFADVGARLVTVPDAIRMRIHLGALVQKEIRKDKLELKHYDETLLKVMKRGTYAFEKEIGDITFIRSIRQGIEACEQDFVPASQRVKDLKDAPTENSIIVHTSQLCAEMQLLDVEVREGTGRQFHVAAPAVFKLEDRNREVAIVSANPGGYFDWDLEILIQEKLDRVPIEIMTLNRQIKLYIDDAGAIRPQVPNSVVQRAHVSQVFVKSARRYMTAEDSPVSCEIEVALVTKWDPAGKTILSQTCAVSLYAADWPDQLDKCNIAIQPRDFGVDCTNLLRPAHNQNEKEGPELLLRFVAKMQKLMDGVMASYQEETSQPPREESLLPGID